VKLTDGDVPESVNSKTFCKQNGQHVGPAKVADGSPNKSSFDSRIRETFEVLQVTR